MSTSYTTDLAALDNHELAFTLFVDGLPFLFGTEGGIVYPGSGGITNPPAVFTSVAALIRDSISVDGLTLDEDNLIVKPGSAQAALRLGPLPGEWDDVLQRRGTKRTYLTVATTETSTSWTVSDSGDFVVGDYLYCERETVKVTAVPSSTSITVDRNQCALTVNDRGGHVHGVGVEVSTSPPYLFGRMAELRGWIGADLSKVVRVIQLAASPSRNLDSNQWSLQFRDGMDRLGRKIAVGFEGSDVSRVGVVTVGTDVSFEISTVKTREFQSADDLGWMACWGAGDEFGLEPILEIVGSLPRVRGNHLITTVRTTEDGESLNVVKARRAYVFTGSPMRAALQVLLSDRGLGSAAGTNHATYDVLFGITSTGNSSTRRVEADEVECRFGAAIPAGMVDVAGLEEFLKINVPGWCYVLGARGEEDLLPFLREVAYALNGIWFVTNAGKLSFKLLDSTPRGQTYSTITATDILTSTPKDSIDDESQIVHTLTMACNYSHVEGKFYGEMHAVYETVKEIYRDVDATLRIERRGLYVALPETRIADVARLSSRVVGTVPLEQVRVGLDRIFAWRSKGIRRYAFNLPWRFSDLNIGDKLTVTSDKFITFDGATLNGITLEVVGLKLDPRAGSQAPVTVEMREVRESVRMSPTGKLNNTSTTTVLQMDGSSKYGDGVTPADWFAVGWKVRVWDKSASPPFSVHEDGVVQSKTTTSLTLTGALATFTPTTGDIVTQDTYDDASDTTVNAQQGLAQHGYGFIASGNSELGAARGDPDKWG